MTSILALTRHEPKCATSRYRTLAYLPHLQQNGFTVDVAPLLGDEYLEKRYTKRVPSPFRLMRDYAFRLIRLFQTRKYDLIWIEREALPWIPYWLEAMLLGRGVKYVLDYDDAIYHRYDQHPWSLVRFSIGTKIAALMRTSAMVIAGNEYIANYARQAGAPLVRHLPTVVDLDKYHLAPPKQNTKLNIGWIGTPITARLLRTIQPALVEACRDNTAYVTAVGAGDFSLPDVPLVVRPWTEESEVREVQEFDVGIMPLSDSAFERGKCGLKLIQYMACGKPVIGTPIGVNGKIIVPGINGYQATTMEEWTRAIKSLQSSPEDRVRMGREGYKIVSEEYSLQVAAPKLAEYMNEAAAFRSSRFVSRAG